jgi:hypothetical protein
MNEGDERRQVLNLTDAEIQKIADAAIDRAVARFKKSALGLVLERLLWIGALLLAMQYHIPVEKLLNGGGVTP